MNTKIYLGSRTRVMHAPFTTRGLFYYDTDTFSAHLAE